MPWCISPFLAVRYKNQRVPDSRGVNLRGGAFARALLGPAATRKDRAGGVIVPVISMRGVACREAWADIPTAPYRVTAGFTETVASPARAERPITERYGELAPSAPEPEMAPAPRKTSVPDTDAEATPSTPTSPRKTRTPLASAVALPAIAVAPWTGATLPTFKEADAANVAAPRFVRTALAESEEVPAIPMDERPRDSPSTSIVEEPAMATVPVLLVTPETSTAEIPARIAPPDFTATPAPLETVALPEIAHAPVTRSVT
jgi:hypothetical protein